MQAKTTVRATDIDRAVAARIRERRLAAGLSQADVARVLNLSFQQVQKYENASNRITAGVLFQIARCLDMPLAELFDGIADAPPPPAPTRPQRLVIEVSRMFQQLPEPQRLAVAGLIRALDETNDITRTGAPPRAAAAIAYHG